MRTGGTIRVGIEVGRIFDAAWLESFLSDLEISVGRFLSFLGDDLSIRRRAIYKKMLAASPVFLGRLTERSGLTVTHGDTHWWNFLFPKIWPPTAQDLRLAALAHRPRTTRPRVSGSSRRIRGKAARI